MPITNQTFNDIKIKTILNNLRTGDAVILDIDDTLLRIATVKYGEVAPKLTESGLPGLLKYLKETGHPVILLTARAKRFHKQTKQQLSELGLEYDSLIHAPSERNKQFQKTETKGRVLLDYLNTLTEEQRKHYKRLHVIDDNEKQLDAMKEALTQDKKTKEMRPMFYWYQPSTQMLERTDDYFPETLDGLSLTASLGGGTASTYLVNTQAGQPFVLKHGSSEDQVKIELLINALYKALGVPVAEVQAYRAMPLELARQMMLPHTALTVQLAEFIEPKPEQDEDAIIKQVCQDFVVHAFMGNIDITKTDNFIQSQTGEIKLIDAGANFIFRALGERRTEEVTAVDEIHSLRDPTQNGDKAEWFKNLSEDDIRAQVKRLVAQHRIIEKTIWDVSEQLELPTSLKQQIINSFSHRLDQLAGQYGFANQSFAKADKVAVSGKTAAGVMHLERREGRLHVLLSKCVKHNWCDNFGGKSDDGDVTLATTARRECKEESGGVLLYSDKELSDASFHDLITETARGQQHLYRMYFVEPPEPLDLQQLNDAEHSEHYWVALEDLQEAIEADNTVLEEGKETITVGGHIIFPPLYEMLKQTPVRTLIDALVKDSPIVKHTQGLASTLPAQELTSYRPIASVKNVTEQIVTTQLNKASVLAEIKTGAKNRKNQFFQSQADSFSVESKETLVLSPSELHLKTIMGGDFIETQSIETNVTRFLNNYSTLELADNEKQRLISQAVDIIEYERAHPELVFFYHGVNGNIAFTYSVYTEIYRLLEADDRLSALRTDNALFHNCLDIQAFIAHFQNIGERDEVDNYDSGFMESALSVNPFLFGSHKIDGSNTIRFYTTNSVSDFINMNNLFQVVFQSMGIEDVLIERLTKLCLASNERGIGRLYQLALPKDQADTYAYAAAPGGKLNPLDIINKKTTAITDIIEAMRGNLIGDNEYIPRLQARVMVPPGAPISAKAYYWSDTEPDKKLHMQIKHLARDVVHDILRHRRKFNKLNSNTALMRFLPEILTEAGVGFGDEKITDALLCDLVDAANFESIKVIVALHPEFKDNVLVSSKAGYSRRGTKSEDQSATLLQRLLAVAHSGETIRAIFGDKFYEGKLDTLIFPEVLAALPRDERLSFVRTNHHQLFTVDELHRILKVLPDANRFDFAIECKDQINNSEQLIQVLKQLPEDNRLAFAKECKDLIRYHFELEDVLRELPGVDRLAFAIEREGIIHNSVELEPVLKLLPEADRLALAIACKDSISTLNELSWVLTMLSSQYSLSLSKECIDLFQTKDDIDLISSCLSIEEQNALSEAIDEHLSQTPGVKFSW